MTKDIQGSEKSRQKGSPRRNPSTNSIVLIAKNRKEIPIDDKYATIKDEKGNNIGVVIVFRDITERRMVEDALKKNEKRFRDVADFLPFKILDYTT